MKNHKTQNARLSRKISCRDSRENEEGKKTAQQHVIIQFIVSMMTGVQQDDFHAMRKQIEFNPQKLISLEIDQSKNNL